MMNKIYKYLYIFAGFYAICVALVFLNVTGIFGKIGRGPFAFFGHKTSIEYMYQGSSYDNYNEFWKDFWMKKGAENEIPKFQSLYGSELLNIDKNKGIQMLTKAAESDDYYAALVLASLYEDPKNSFSDKILAMKFRKMADSLRLKQPKPLQ